MHTQISEAPAAAARVSPRARQRLTARLARRDGALLEQALATGSLALRRCPRLRLADGALLTEECTPHWTRAGHPVSAALLTAKGTAPLAVGRWMLREACRGPGPVSLPLPPALLSPFFFPELKAAVIAGAPTLELRLPEAAVLAPTTETLLALSALRDLGVGLVLAEFGLRYGAACALRDLPLTGVQLEPGLTQAACADAEAASFAAALATVAHSQRLTVTARSVQAPGHAAALRHLGIDAASGPGLIPACAPPPGRRTGSATARSG